MHDQPLPYGYGRKVEEPEKDKLYVVNFDCEFAVKSNKFPFLQIKNNPRYKDNEFVRYSDGIENVTMTNVDYENFKKNYKVFQESNHTFVQFDSKIGLMADHVDYWMKKKKEYEAQGLPFMRYIAKTMMNGFYGKTALRTIRQNVIPEFSYEDDRISYSTRVETEIDPVYIPYGTFVTAWARHKLIDSALKVWDDFVYCDTDSIHCFERKSYPFPTHPTELGLLKDETSDGAYEYARYIKQKTYCHARPGKDQYGNPIKEVVEIRAAGLNSDSRSGISIDDFKYGLEIKNANFKMKTVPGGAILYPTDWKLEKLDEDMIEEYFKNLEKRNYDTGEWTV